MLVGFAIVLLVAVNFWGALILIGLEKLHKQLSNDHGSNFKGECDEPKNHRTENFLASDDRIVR